MKPTISKGLHEGICQLWMKEELCDFTVVVENTDFKTHRLVLSACSDFFRALLQSDMKENQENCARISGMTKDTFSTIINSVYMGVDRLTEKNVIDIWHASHQLQMNFMVEDCENFVTENLSVDNFYDICEHAKLLASERVFEFCKKFMLQNFEVLRKMEGFLELPAADVDWITKDDHLNVQTEDSVIEAIVEWVCYTQQRESGDESNTDDDVADTSMDGAHANKANFHDGIHEQKTQTCATEDSSQPDSDKTSHDDESNHIAKSTDGSGTHRETHAILQDDTEKENVKKMRGKRLHYFQAFMRGTRLYLASSEFLENLLQHTLLSSCKEVHDMMLDALMYRLRVKRRHNSWPRAAIHRASSDMEHVMLYVNDGCLRAYRLGAGTTHEYDSLPTDRGSFMSLAVFDDVLCLERTTKGNSNARLTMYNRERTWKLILNEGKSISHSFKLLAHGDYLYLLGKDWNYLQRCCCTTCSPNCWSEFTTFVSNKAHSIIACGQYIISFYDDTPPTCLDPTTMTAWDLDPLDGPKENVIAFSVDESVYILQRNGALSKIVNTSCAKKLKFHLAAKLWDFDWEIYGAVFYRDELFVFGSFTKPEDKSWKTSVPGVFPNIKYVQVTSSCAQCVPMVVPKDFK